MRHRTCRLIQLCATLGLLASSLPGVAGPLVLDAAPYQEVIEHLVTLHEGDQPLTLSEVQELRRAGAFTAAPKEGVNRGYDVAAYWYHLELDNRDGAAPDRVFEITFPPLDYVDVYLQAADGEVMTIRTGDQRPLDPGQIRHRHFAIPLSVAPGTRLQLYFRVQTEGSHQVPVRLWQTRAFMEASQSENLIFGLYFGVLAVMLFYNLCLGIFTDDRGYFPYVGVVLFFGGLQANLSGYAYQYLPLVLDHAGTWINLSVPVLSGLSTAAVPWFAYVFLDVPKNLPGFRHPILILLCIGLAITGASLLLDYRLIVPIAAAMSIPATLTCVAAGIAAALKGLRVARFYLLGWGALVVGILLKMAELFGLLPPSPVTLYGWQLGMLVTVLLLSAALADRINLDRKAKLNAQSEALQAREQLITNLSRYRRLVDNVREGLFEADVTGRLQSVNPAMLQLFEQPDAASVVVQSGRTDDGLTVEPGGFQTWCRRAISDTPVRDAEVAFRRADGSHFWGLLSLQVNRDDTGQPLSLDGRLFDVSQRKVNEQLARERAVAEAATSAKSDFLAQMSHELRTPMNAVIGFTSLALQTDDDHQRINHLHRIESASHTLLHIINDILDLSKVEAGKLDLEQSSFDLIALLRRVETMLLPPAAAKGLQVHFTYPPDLRQYCIGDPLRLEQVLSNLTGNAVKFTEQGEVWVRVEQQADGADAQRLRFRVSDTGIGISSSQCRSLFKPFVQGDASTTRRYGGTGLGLAIAQQLVTLMGGKISVDSTPGQGSTFQFEIRLRHGTARPTAAAPPPAAIRMPGNGLLNGMRLLLAEDNDLNRELAQQILQSAGAQVDVAAEGAAAVHMVSAEHYDAVLMDLQMPGVDGYHATRQIRALPGRSRLPIIAVTANAMPRDRDACLAAGMTGFLSKPINIEQMIRVVASFRSSENGPSQATARSVVANAPASLPGIDFDAAAQRLGGRRALLTRLLKDFARDEVDTPDRIEALLQQEHLDAARRAAHRLKGIAASMGCTALAEAAASLEDDCRDGIADSVEDVRAAHDEVLRSIGLLPDGASEPASGPEDLANTPLSTSLERLVTLLQRGEFAASDLADSLSSTLQAAFPDNHARFQTLIGRFDLLEAAAIVQEWQSRMDTEHLRE